MLTLKVRKLLFCSLMVEWVLSSLSKSVIHSGFSYECCTSLLVCQPAGRSLVTVHAWQRLMWRLTCWDDDPLLLSDVAGWGGGLGADAGLLVGGLVQHGGFVVTHMSGAFGDATVHGGLTTGTETESSLLFPTKPLKRGVFFFTFTWFGSQINT